jgi:hypothetical protein
VPANLPNGGEKLGFSEETGFLSGAERVSQAGGDPTMGMDYSITFAGRTIPSYEAVRARLAAHGFPIEMRMMDGELAFPDELPAEGWRELRIGTPGGMVTVRREGERVSVITWGNAEGAMRQAWQAVTWAFAEAGAGVIETPAGSWSAAEFRQAVDLSPILRSPPYGEGL